MNRIESYIVRVVGPGGAGKTTVGQALAARLGIAFVDVDEQFAVRAGDISQFLSAHSYEVYAARNVGTYLEMLNSLQDAAVMALSSGFITYPDDVHRDYERLRRDILASPTTLVLLPSFDREICVAETVRRQLTRPFSRSSAREEQVIRARFGIYRNLVAQQFETDRPIDAIVNDICAHLLLNCSRAVFVTSNGVAIRNADRNP